MDVAIECDAYVRMTEDRAQTFWIDACLYAARGECVTERVEGRWCDLALLQDALEILAHVSWFTGTIFLAR